MRAEDSWGPVDLKKQDEWEVEHLLDRRGSGPNEEFLVKWRGFPKEEATWEPIANLENSKALVQAYRSSEAKRRHEGA